MDLTTITPTTWFALGYSMLLLGVAYGIDRVARRTATAVTRQRSGGFRYHPDHDAWLCPEDQWLWPQSFDPDNRVMRYRASPTVCNSCPVRDECTTSTSGREIQRHVDPWPASEAARFHRGIACAVASIAVIWPAVAALASDNLAETLLLLGTSVIMMLASLPLWSHLRHTPADPHGVLVHSSDQNVASRKETAARVANRRTKYGSDRRASVDLTAVERRNSK